MSSYSTLFNLMFSVTAVAWGSGAQAEVQSAVIDRPALMTSLALRSMLTSVATNGKRVLVVGERGHILLSEDQGGKWIQAKVPVSVTLTAVRLVGENLGWAVGHGGVVLKSVDGGQTWSKQLDGRSIATLLQKHATLSGDAKLLREAQQWIDDGPDKPILDLYFWDANNGWVVGAYGLILATKDGGATWAPIMDRIPNHDRRHIYAIRVHEGSIYLAGEQGSVYRAISREANFERLAVPYKGSFFDVVIAPGGTLLLLGLRGNLFRSDDNGKVWERIDLHSKYTLTSGIVRADGAVMLVDESGNGWLSMDQGRTFKRVPFEHSFPLTGLVQLPSNGMLLVGARGVLSAPAQK